MSCVAAPGRKPPKTKRKSKPASTLRTHAPTGPRARNLTPAQQAKRDRWAAYDAVTVYLTCAMTRETRAELDAAAVTLQAQRGRRTSAYHVVNAILESWAAAQRAARGETGPEPPAGNTPA